MLQIKEEYKKLIYKIDNDEFKDLENNCIKEGIREPIITYNGFIIDGHNRYEIAQKHNLDYKTIEMQFDSETEVEVWMYLNQLGRRNLNDWQKYDLRDELNKINKLKGLKEKSKGGELNKEVLSKIDKSYIKKDEERHNSRNELAKELKWGNSKVAQADVIKKRATEEQIEKLQKGDASINQVYQEIKKEENKSLFKQGSLREKFIEPPFSVLDLKQGSWSKRKSMWLDLGIKSEIGRKTNTHGDSYGFAERFKETTSIFNPALCEVLYHWFCPDGGKILDPFAGGSVRGIVANKLGYNYTGIDVRQEQIDSNREQAIEILGVDNQPNYYVGDSNLVLNDFTETFDYLFTCPPYADLEVYSDLEGDISNMSYSNFINIYKSIIEKSCNLLKENSFACFVVGEVRDKNGNYYGFVPDTIKIFQSCGMSFYNEAILLDQLGSASMRANNTMKNKKLVKVHQNILVFKK
jgi:DNA modification methylase